MKYFLLFVCFLLASCKNEDVQEHIRIFPLDGEGRPQAASITMAELNEKVMGYGWRLTFLSDIEADGSCQSRAVSPESYPCLYWGNDFLRKYYYDTEFNLPVYEDERYEGLDDPMGYVNGILVLSANEEEMEAITCLPFHGDAKDARYAYTVYKKMSGDELKYRDSKCAAYDHLGDFGNIAYDEKNEPFVQRDPISRTDFENEIMGSGWEHVKTYNIRPGTDYYVPIPWIPWDANWRPDDIFEWEVQSEPVKHFYFGDDRLRIYCFYPNGGDKKCREESCVIGDPVGRLRAGNENLFIVSVKDDELRLIRLVMKDRFGYSVYRRMSADELDRCNEEYVKENR